MERAYLLQHERNDTENVKGIGVYSSERLPKRRLGGCVLRPAFAIGRRKEPAAAVSDVALTNKLCANMSVRRPPHLRLDETQVLDLYPDALAQGECVDCSHFAAFERHGDEANIDMAFVAAMNDCVDLDVDPFVPGDPALPAPHGSHFIGLR